MQVEMRGVVSYHRGVQPLSIGDTLQRITERGCGHADLRRLLRSEICPSVRVTARDDQQVSELRLWLEQRRHVKRDNGLGLPDESARNLYLARDLLADIALAHEQDPTPARRGRPEPKEQTRAACHPREAGKSQTTTECPLPAKSRFRPHDPDRGNPLVTTLAVQTSAFRVAVG